MSLTRPNRSKTLCPSTALSSKTRIFASTSPKVVKTAAVVDAAVAPAVVAAPVEWVEGEVDHLVAGIETIVLHLLEGTTRGRDLKGEKWGMEEGHRPAISTAVEVEDMVEEAVVSETITNAVVMAVVAVAVAVAMEVREMVVLPVAIALDGNLVTAGTISPEEEAAAAAADRGEKVAAEDRRS